MRTPRAVVLVEGASDQVALQTLARRRGRDLDAEGVNVVAMGGATNIAKFVARYGADRARVTLAGMCDAGEERHYWRALERVGLGVCRSRPDLEKRGFYVCDADLEDELIRSLGVDGVEEVIDAAGELSLFRRFVRQPAQRERTAHAQLRRFMGTRSGRKIEYAGLLVERLDPARVPRPLDGVLARL